MMSMEFNLSRCLCLLEEKLEVNLLRNVREKILIAVILILTNFKIVATYSVS